MENTSQKYLSKFTGLEIQFVIFSWSVFQKKGNKVLKQCSPEKVVNQ
jgi:uncharacterized lipoprotein YehR (DUF1307 family)